MALACWLQSSHDVSLTPEELSILQLSCKVAASCLVVSIIPAICVGWFWHVKTFGEVIH